MLQDVQRQTSAEAILFSSLSTFQPYPPLRIGIKLTLVRVHDGAVLWQFDDGFNAGEASTLNDARKYLRESMGIETDPPPALSVDSPQRFIRYGVSRAVRLLKRNFQPAPNPHWAQPTAARRQFPRLNQKILTGITFLLKCRLILPHFVG